MTLLLNGSTLDAWQLASLKISRRSNFISGHVHDSWLQNFYHTTSSVKIWLKIKSRFSAAVELSNLDALFDSSLRFFSVNVHGRILNTTLTRNHNLNLAAWKLQSLIRTLMFNHYCRNNKYSSSTLQKSFYETKLNWFQYANEVWNMTSYQSNFFVKSFAEISWSVLWIAMLLLFELC